MRASKASANIGTSLETCDEMRPEAQVQAGQKALVLAPTPPKRTIERQLDFVRILPCLQGEVRLGKRQRYKPLLPKARAVAAQHVMPLRPHL